MNFKSLAKIIKTAAPLLGGALGGPAGAFAAKLIAKKFGLSAGAGENDLLAACDKPGASARLAEIEEENRGELERLALAQNIETQKTYRAELSSGHGYARNWRPTFGYALALTWTAQTLGVTIAALIAIFSGDPAQITAALNGLTQIIGASFPLWGVALSVLGLSIHQRSRDKATAAGGLTGLLGGLLGGKKQ